MLTTKTETPQPPSHGDVDTAVTIANALREKFGSDAAAVADAQYRAACDETRVSWQAVLSHLRG